MVTYDHPQLHIGEMGKVEGTLHAITHPATENSQRKSACGSRHFEKNSRLLFRLQLSARIRRSAPETLPRLLLIHCSNTDLWPLYFRALANRIRLAKMSRQRRPRARLAAPMMVRTASLKKTVFSREHEPVQRRII